MKKEGKLRKGIALVLSTVMAVSLVPVPDVSKKAMATSPPFEKTEENTGLSTNQIGSPTSTSSEATKWVGSYVYFGNYQYENEPVRYRVLAPKTSDFGGNTMLLDCEKTIANVAFDMDGGSNEAGVNPNVWANSDLKKWLNEDNADGKGFFAKTGVFTEQEKNAIVQSTGGVTGLEANQSLGDYGVYLEDGSFSTNGDWVFVLNAKEASKPSYGYASNDTRKKNGSSTAGWWLRSPDEDDASTAAAACTAALAP